MIVFETHSTSLHNEAGVASGRLDVDLSPRGEREAAELGTRHRDGGVDIVYASDLELGESVQMVMEEVERIAPARIVFDSLSEIRLLARAGFGNPYTVE